MVGQLLGAINAFVGTKSIEIKEVGLILKNINLTINYHVTKSAEY